MDAVEIKYYGGLTDLHTRVCIRLHIINHTMLPLLRNHMGRCDAVRRSLLGIVNSRDQIIDKITIYQKIRN